MVKMESVIRGHEVTLYTRPARQNDGLDGIAGEEMDEDLFTDEESISSDDELFGDPFE